MEIFTIGYEGFTVETFFEVLQAHDIQVLADVRELPLSRKAGFSKTALSLGAQQHELEYLHLSALGCPRAVRHQLRADGNWTRYQEQFSAYLETQDAAMEKLANLAREQRCCLLCFEADASDCHRSIVATRLQEMSAQDWEIVHLNRTSRVADLVRV